MKRSFELKLMRKLSELRQEKLEQLGQGVEYEQYRYWLGYIKAFEDFVNVVAELKKREDEDNG